VPAESAPRVARADAAWIIIGVLAFHAAFSGTPFDKPGVGVLWFAEVGLIWTAAFIIALVALSSGWASARATSLIAAGGVAAATALLVHNLIDFSLLKPAGLAAFVALALPCAGLARGAQTSRSRATISAGLAAALIASTAHVVAVVYPTVATANLVADADAAFASARSPAQLEPATQIDLAAAQADGLDADTPRRAARRQLQLALQPGVPAEPRTLFLSRAADLASISQSRAPQSVPTKRLLARIADATANPAAADSLLIAAKRWDVVTTAYPTSAQDHLDAGLAYFRLWQATQNPGPAGSALDHFQAALRIDASRPEDNASRLRPDELDRIRGALQKMQPDVQRRAEQTP
jgi:hypothetical protein